MKKTLAEKIAEKRTEKENREAANLTMVEKRLARSPKFQTGKVYNREAK
jgi:hypothetical protein